MCILNCDFPRHSYKQTNTAYLKQVQRAIQPFSHTPFSPPKLGTQHSSSLGSQPCRWDPVVIKQKWSISSLSGSLLATCPKIQWICLVNKWREVVNEGKLLWYRNAAAIPENRVFTQRCLLLNGQTVTWNLADYQQMVTRTKFMESWACYWTISKIGITKNDMKGRLWSRPYESWLKTDHTSNSNLILHQNIDAHSLIFLFDGWGVNIESFGAETNFCYAHDNGLINQVLVDSAIGRTRCISCMIICLGHCRLGKTFRLHAVGELTQ